LDPGSRLQIEKQLGRLPRFDGPIEKICTAWGQEPVAVCVVMPTQMVYLVRGSDNKWSIARVEYFQPEY
jgi:hypothetical protein